MFNIKRKIIYFIIIVFLVCTSTPAHVYAADYTGTSATLTYNQGSTVTYNQEWYKADRSHFNELLKKGRKSKTTIYSEYTSLLNELNRIDQKAYRGKKGYLLFSPELTEEYNIVLLAVNARSALLDDMYYGKIQSLKQYYPTYKYAFINYNLFQVADENDSSVTIPFTIEPTDKFTAYNQQKLVNALDQLDIPDYYLYGTRLYFINGKPNGLISAFNSINSVRGYYDNYIAVFNTAENTDELMSTVMHEVGHSVGNEIFTTYGKNYTVGSENTKTMDEYAAIYGKDTYSTDANISWEDSLLENFAEDFSSIYAGAEKHTSWQGNHLDEVDTFIEKELAQIQTDTVPLVKGLTLASDRINTSIPLSSIDYDYNFYTKKSTVKIKLTGLKSAGEQIGAMVYNEDGYNKITKVSSKGIITVSLPDTGEYNIVVGSIKKVSYYNRTYTTVGDKVLFAGDINYIK